MVLSISLFCFWLSSNSLSRFNKSFFNEPVSLLISSIAVGAYALIGFETENDDDDSDSGSGGLMNPI